MTEQSTKASLYRKIAAVAGAIGSVEKDGRNKDQGYRYATPASVMSAVKPIMEANNLGIIPCLMAFEAIDTGQTSSRGAPYIINRVTMSYILIDGETGDDMAVPWQAQAGTYGDDKGLAKAQTIALRTFLIQLFQIPAEDPEIDPDAGQKAPQQPQRSGARYDGPQAPIAAQKAAQQATGPQTQAEWLDLLEAAWNKELTYGGIIPEDDQVPDMSTLTIDEIKTRGKKSKERLAALQKAAKQPA